MSVTAAWADLLEGEELAHLEEVPAREALLVLELHHAGPPAAIAGWLERSSRPTG